LLASILSGIAVADDGLLDRPDWGAYFAEFGATGTLVVVDERQTPPATLVYNRDRAKRRYSPASTFKIPHTLFALDAGVVVDEFQVFAWDGVMRTFAGHNQDQNLRSAMRYSTLWVYQRFAKQIAASGGFAQERADCEGRPPIDGSASTRVRRSDSSC
jgi:beta-lactamase class D